MLQYFAQGAAMAMEDAVCLASAADACDGQFAEAFQRYQAMRLVRASRVQISSRMLGPLYHAADVSRLVRNDIYRGRSAERYYDALDWIFTAPDYVRDFGGANSSQRRVDS
jgi:salicylate hydroxylase